VWIYAPNSIASEFPGDWRRLAEHPLMLCRVNREPVSGKGRYQSLDLRNVRTLSPAYGQDRGSFVSTYKKENDISTAWPANLAKAQSDGLLDEATASTLLKLFSEFQQSYREAVMGFFEEGLAFAGLSKQATAFSTLL